MAFKIFEDYVPAMCKYCAKSSRSGEKLMCGKKEVSPDGSCRRYSYDPLRRVPRQQPRLKEYSQSDFKI